MASLSGVSGSNTTSSLYNSANIISGLASGLDTEGMIENLVKGYQSKINSLSQKATKLEWKQEAYRSIISKMYSFTNKYTSYSSGTNLMSRTFFNSAVKVLTQGANADKVSASGKTDSDISLDRVTQLAKAAQFRTTGNLQASLDNSIVAGEGIDLTKTTTLGAMQGSLVLNYGSKSVSINFDEVDDVKAMDEIRTKLADEKGIDKDAVDNADVLAGLITQKLEGQKIVFNNGESESADQRIKVTVKDGSISFSDNSTAGNSVYITRATGNVGEVLGLGDLSNAKEDQPASFKVPENLTREELNAKHLSGAAINLTLDGVTKTIKLPEITGNETDGYKFKDKDGNEVNLSDADAAKKYTELLSESVGKAFKNKVTVSNVATDGKLQLKFQAKSGSDLTFTSDVGEALGVGKTATSYLDTNKTLGELLGEDKLSALTPTGKKDDKGNDTYAFEINGVKVGEYSKDTKVSDIISAVNSNKDAGVKIAYSKATKDFIFTSKETGEDSAIEIGGGLAAAMFGVDTSRKTADYLGDDLNGTLAGNKIQLEVNGKQVVDFTFKKDDSTLDGMLKQINNQLKTENLTASFDNITGALVLSDEKGNRVDYTTGSGDTIGQLLQKDQGGYTKGQDAVFTVTVNGQQMDMTRSSNSVDIDGLTINMKAEFDGTTDGDGPVTFKSSTDSDKIVDAIKSMITDYNEMISEIKSAYSTMPYQKSSGAFANYEPLTDEDRNGMSESAIEAYEKKAKQGILFGDRDLSNLYNKLRDALAPLGTDGAYLRGMGITTSYSDGLQTISLDEDKLRSMLESEPDTVMEVFTKSDGVMQNLKNQLDYYGRTTGDPKGVLIEKAGSPLSPLSIMNNQWQQQIDNLNTQIEKWQDKMSSQVDRYTQQFSRLEQLIQQMNSQSSTLSGLMGGG